LAEGDESSEPEHPRISLVVSHVDRAAPLREALERALNQTWPEVEVLAVDHVADSASREALARSAGRVTGILAPDRSQAEGLQAAVEQSRGRYVGFLESGDLLAADAVAVGLESAKKLAQWVWKQMLLARDLAATIPAGARFILVDEEQLNRQVAAGRQAIPFLERDGKYWGLPPDGATAVGELERLRAAGAQFIVFAWPAFWWLSHYRELGQHLANRYPRIFANDRLIVYRLDT